MYFSDEVQVERIRPAVPFRLSTLGHPEKGPPQRVTLPARVWANREGHRESVTAITQTQGTIRIEGFSVGIPVGSDVREDDRVVSMKVDGREWLTEDDLGAVLALRVRGVIRHHYYDELQCETVR